MVAIDPVSHSIPMLAHKAPDFRQSFELLVLYHKIQYSRTRFCTIYSTTYREITMKSVIDIEKRTISVGTHQFSIQGLEAEIFWFLALRGAQEFLERRKDPVAAWNHLLAGNLDGRAAKPKSDLRLAIERVGTEAGGAAPDKDDPRVKAAVLRIRADRLDAAATPRTQPDPTDN